MTPPGLYVLGDEIKLVAGDLALWLDRLAGARVKTVSSAALPNHSLVERWWCGYAADGETWSDAPRPGELPFEGGPVRVRQGGRSARPEVVAQVVSPHLRVEKRFTLYPGLPFVRVRYRVETTGVEGRGPGLSLGLPAIRFHDVLADPFDLKEDTADDGQDLGGGLALPAWRIFADPGGEYGLVVFAAERQTMSRLQVTERGCAFRPSYYLAYSTEVVTTRELRLGLKDHNYGPVDEVDWFLGAYRRATLPELRRRIAGFHARRRPARRRAGPYARLGQALEVSAAAGAYVLPPVDALPRVWPTPPPPRRAAIALPSGEGQVVLGAEALAERARAARWQVVQSADVPGGWALLARPGSGAAALRIEPRLGGSHDVWAGLAGGVGLKVRLDGDPYWTYLTADPQADAQHWRPLESVCRGAVEGRIRRAIMDGRGLEVAPHPNVQGLTVLTHVRFAPAPAPGPAPALARRRRFVAGLADTPDVSYELAADSFHEEAWRESLWQHAAHGIDTVYWRVDGQCSDFHTKVGTVRYSVPRTHALYSPISRYYGLALERLDPLRLAVEESRRRGVRLFGWMRANNYSGNAVARFFVEHPEWHEEREDGGPAPQLCFAYPEVRAHKAAILREAAAYGLNGLLIDTLRHPPMVGYAPVVVAAFRERYGEDPPRAPEARLPLERTENRSGARWERWFRFRAEYFTQFVRDLRAGLAVDGRGRLPLHVRVAPQRFLHDGADLEALLDEGLVDGVVANRYRTEALDYERLFPVVRGRVPVCAVCDPLRNDPIELLHDLWCDERLAGVGLYESEWSVHVPEHREALLALAARSAR
jgi:hypothetical protein